VAIFSAKGKSTSEPQIITTVDSAMIYKLSKVNIGAESLQNFSTPVKQSYGISLP
jgi:hypothetical protein